MNEIKKGLLKVFAWSGIRIAIIVYLFMEIIKLVDYVGGIVAFLFYLLVTEWIWEKTKPIDKLIAKDLKKVKAKGKGKMRKTFGKKGEQFWDGFNSPMKLINQDEVKKK